MYSGVFNDIGGSLVPQGLVEEEGRLPYGRGPKAVQEAGIPYYRLTRLGRLACLALDKVPNKEDMLSALSKESDDAAEARALGAAAVIARFSPEFVTLLFDWQARAYSEGSADSLLPTPGADGGGGVARAGGLAPVLAGFVDGLARLPEGGQGDGHGVCPRDRGRDGRHAGSQPLKPVAASGSPMAADARAAKLVMDPIHGFINIREYPVVGELVETGQFQRLRRIGQLGLAHLVYPSATHTRFAHSLGAMKTFLALYDSIMGGKGAAHTCPTRSPT